MALSGQVNRTTYSVQRKNQESNTPEQKPAASLDQSHKANTATTTSKIQNFKELRVWVDGMTLVKEVYKVTERFPQKELYGLSSQLRRCAISVPSNIAEGFRRNHAKKFQQFLHIALGSLAEAETQILIAGDLGYISSTEEKPLLELINKINRRQPILEKGCSLNLCTMYSLRGTAQTASRSSRNCPHAASISRPAVLRKVT